MSRYFALSVGSSSQSGNGGSPLKSKRTHARSNSSAGRGDNCDNVATVMVVNPTSVLHKAPLFKALEADLIGLSETSAVATAQQRVGAEMRPAGYRCHWGHPVLAHAREGSSKEILRGLASGVAILSRIPSHPSVVPLPPEVSETCRLHEAFVRFGALSVRVLVLCGVPQNHLDARERTNWLLEQAFDRATQNAVPCLVLEARSGPPVCTGARPLSGRFRICRSCGQLLALHLLDPPVLPVPT